MQVRIANTQACRNATSSSSAVSATVNASGTTPPIQPIAPSEVPSRANVQAQRDAVTLKYQSRSYGEDWSDVEQRVATKWTPCRFGGERPWFVCSVAANGVYCGRRVTKAVRSRTPVRLPPLLSACLR